MIGHCRGWDKPIRSSLLGCLMRMLLPFLSALHNRAHLSQVLPSFQRLSITLDSIILKFRFLNPSLPPHLHACLTLWNGFLDLIPFPIRSYTLRRRLLCTSFSFSKHTANNKQITIELDRFEFEVVGLWNCKEFKNQNEIKLILESHCDGDSRRLQRDYACHNKPCVHSKGLRQGDNFKGKNIKRMP